MQVNIGAYSIGKSQEAIKILNQEGIVPQISDTIKKYCEVYQKFGVKLKYLGNDEPSNISIRPMHLINHSDNNMTKNCVLTGWAETRDYGIKGFSLSDHCDFKQLLEFVRKVNPKKVFVVHGSEKEFSKAIREKLKIPAQPLKLRNQRTILDFD